MPRRRAGAWLPLELEILDCAIALQHEGEGVYGFSIAKRLSEQDGRESLIAHGTLYKALARMTAAGALESTWEDPSLSEAEGRPRRRLYRVTPAGQEAVAAERQRLQQAERERAASARPAANGSTAAVRHA